jgi:hypothetical protein
VAITDRNVTDLELAILERPTSKAARASST